MFRVLLFALLFASTSAFAQSANIIGSWNFNIYLGSANYPQTWTIDTFTPGSGAITGGGSANGFIWTFTGTAAGGAISMDFIYTNLPTYFGNLTGTFTGECFMSGTWTGPGQAGVWDATKANCGSVGGGGPTDKRGTAIRMFCNRSGPSLEQASCAVTVGDAGAPPRSTPTGSVEFTAREGFFPGEASCLLTQTPYSPGVASCTAFFQVPFGFPIVTAFPIDATYLGDTNFEPSSTSHELIQAGCIGSSENPCSGSVSLSFADIPQIVENIFSSVVGCGGAVSKIRTSLRDGKLPKGNCSVTVNTTLSAAEILSGIEDRAILGGVAQALRKQVGSQAYTKNEGIVFEAIGNVADEISRSEQVHAAVLGQKIVVSQMVSDAIERLIDQGGLLPLKFSNSEDGNLRAKKKRKPKLKLIPLSSVKGVVKINNQRTFQQRAKRNAAAFLEALREGGVEQIPLTMTVTSKRLGKKLPSGVKRKEKVEQQLQVGLP